MSKENVALVQKGFAAFARHSLADLVSLLSPDVTWRTAGKEKDAPFWADFHGPDGVARYFLQLIELVEISELVPLEFLDAGDRVVVLGRNLAKVRKTGRTYSTEWCQVFTFRDGRIVDIMNYTDTAAIAEAFRG